MDTYTHVNPEFYEALDRLKNKSLVVHYFINDNNLETARGDAKYTYFKKEDGEYIIMQDDTEIRLDTIITINGNPGPAFDEYDAYANACMDCHGGMEL